MSAGVEKKIKNKNMPSSPKGEAPHKEKAKGDP